MPPEGLGPPTMGQGQYLSLQASGIQDGDPGPTAGPHGILQAQQRADGPRPHGQAHRRALQIPGDASWREIKKRVRSRGWGGEGHTGREPRAPQPSEPWPAAGSPSWASGHLPGPFSGPSPSSAGWWLLPSASVHVAHTVGVALPSPSFPPSHPFPLSPLIHATHT